MRFIGENKNISSLDLTQDDSIFRRLPSKRAHLPRSVTMPGWPQLAFFSLLVLTAAAYLINLTASGDANPFYAAAVQAGTKSWKAFLFGSLDPSNFITVDKPPASLWVMEISGRVFGFSSASMLIPQVLEGVAAVGLLCASVRRWFGNWAGLAAGALLALTPVFALMFRFNNPDALLVLSLVASAYCLTRALEKASTKWIVGAGALIGLGFLAKMGQAFLVLPGFALVYMIAAPTTLRKRILQLLAGGGAILISAGWWVALVELWPAGSRPLIDGSPDNSILNLITGYNGLSRIFGGGGPSGGSGGGGGGANFSGPEGPLRLFDSLMGGQVSWLLPLSLLALILGIWSRGRAPRTDRIRAALLLWGSWLLLTAAVFSFSRGVIHTYYTVALAPAIAGLVAIGGAMLWEQREKARARLIAVASILGSAAWAYELLERTPHWNPWLRPVIVALAVVSSGGLLLSIRFRNMNQKLVFSMAVLGVAAILTGPIAFTADTISTAHTGALPAAGPAVANTAQAGAPPGAGGATGGGARFGSRGAPPQLFGNSAEAGHPPGAIGNGKSSKLASLGAAGRGGGSPGAATQVSHALKIALHKDASSYRWVAATSGSNSAASLELATDDPVMAIGGFNNQAEKLNLSTFEGYVNAGEIHYYIAGGGNTGPGGGNSDKEISKWVEANFKSETIGGQTVYNLSSIK